MNTKPLTLNEAHIQYQRVDPKAPPPADVNLVMRLTSGITLVGRNILGRCCLYDPHDDRYVSLTAEDDGDDATWRFVDCYFVIPEPEPSP